MHLRNLITKNTMWEEAILQCSHFFNSMPSGALPSTFLVPTSFQFVDSTVPFDSTCWRGPDKYVTRISQKYYYKAKALPTNKFLVSWNLVLTNDFIMALLVSSSASLYMSLKNLFSAASPSSFSSFSCKQKISKLWDQRWVISSPDANISNIYPPPFWLQLQVYPNPLVWV